MQRFFVEPNDITEEIITISGSDANHISHSLRSRVGDVLLVSPLYTGEVSEYIEYLCEITAFSKDAVTLKINSKSVSRSEPQYKARLFMAMPKSDKMELIIQKSTELGVYEITPVLTERCIVKINPRDNDKNEKKIARWQKIAEAAASQCGRAHIPKINQPISYIEAINTAKKSDIAFLCYEGDGTTPLPNILNKEAKIKDISFIVGAEGGFSEKEAEIAKSNLLHSVGLGKRILRCETAPLFVLSAIAFTYEL